MPACTPVSTGGIYVALGANLPSRVGPPLDTLRRALMLIDNAGMGICRMSPWFETPPMHGLDQPLYTNGVIELDSAFAPQELMQTLHDIEGKLGRTRDNRWESRVIDLDLVDYRGLVQHTGSPILPHPGATTRAFVLVPLACIAPQWRDPVSGRSISNLIADLPDDPHAMREIVDDCCSEAVPSDNRP